MKSQATSTESSQPEFIELLKRRDSGALSEVVHNHSRPLFRAALGMGFAPDEAEDLVQNVFMVFLETLDRFEGRSKVRTWLFGILHRKALERRRSRIRDGRHDPIDDVVESRFSSDGAWVRPPADFDRHLETNEMLELLDDCMEGLSDLQRRVFVLRDMEELESAEVCKILEISRTNMFVLTFRARNRLRECLEQKSMETQK